MSVGLAALTQVSRFSTVIGARRNPTESRQVAMRFRFHRIF